MLLGEQRYDGLPDPGVHDAFVEQDDRRSLA
jgi:hypothetical protein